ncbi:MAG: endopeptidase La [Oscillospiraceae bacterium]|nr:endopeptidase La [Oscillospiraceae bacterium]
MSTVNKSNKKERITLPLLPMRGLVIFPGMVLHFDVGKSQSVEALKAAAASGRKIFLVTQKEQIEPITIDIGDELDEASGGESGDGRHPQPNPIDELYKIGVVTEIRQILKTPEGTTRVLVEGLHKAKLTSVDVDGAYMLCDVLPVKNAPSRISKKEETALTRMLLDSFKRYGLLAPKMPPDLYQAILGEKKLEKLFDHLVFNVYLRPEDKQMLLELSGIKRRAETLLSILENEIGIMELEINIHSQVRENMEKNQREYYLREQMRVLARQLGDRDDPHEEMLGYIEEIESIGFDEEIEDKLISEAEKLMKHSSHSHESGVVRTYLDTVLELPWNEYSDEKLDISKAEKQLNRDHYGLKDVKERILEMFAVRALKPDVKGQIICLAGPPGVGKTSIGKSIAKSLGRKFARISLGGVRDEAEIRGHRKTYVGAMPGRFVAALKSAKSMNPVILLDEIDKLSGDYKGDPASALLEVLDSEQNSAFVDHYLEIPVDLSQVMFITTANNTDYISSPLLDRMEVIELSSYTRVEKMNIAKKHLVPKQLKKHGLLSKAVKINQAALYTLIDCYTREAGVRKLERKIATLCRKAAKEIVAGLAETAAGTGEKSNTVVKFDADNVEKYLGVKKYLPESISKENEVGLVNGLAWTSVGGVLMPLETAVMNGTGKIEITGSLGEVMTESSKIAISLVRMLVERYEDFSYCDEEFYKNKDLHIHAPEGAVPKNGPSAGIAIVTALVSTLTGIAIRRDVAMTGEITLHGKVLAIGGLKEKTMAAYKSGVKTVILPKENEPDIFEIDEAVRKGLTFVPVERIENVLELALVRPLRPKQAELSGAEDLGRAAKNIVDGFSVDNCSPEPKPKPKRVRR